MKVCPNCQYKELTGAIFCSECGAQLIFSQEDRPGTVVYTAQTSPVDGASEETPPPLSTGLFGATVSLRIVDSNITLPLARREEITLGRVSGNQTIVPDIDLSPFGGYEAGVSRLHAALQLRENKITLIDQGSANGTRINGKRVVPNIAHPIHHGDMITLGKLKVQVLIRES